MQNRQEDWTLGYLDTKHRMVTRKALNFAVEKKNKFGAKRCQRDGHSFDSLAEGREYDYQKKRLLAGEIKSLEIHPTYEIIINDRLVCKVELDFRFFDIQQNKIRILDKKGMDNPMSKLKRKLVEAAHGIMVELV